MSQWRRAFQTELSRGAEGWGGQGVDMGRVRMAGSLHHWRVKNKSEAARHKRET